MNKNKKIGLVIMGILVLIVVFYAGIAYGKNHATTTSASTAQGFGQNIGGMRGGRGGGGFTIGKIISKDASSITVELMNGGPNASTQTGSKIIFLDTATKITKSVDGAPSDLTTGEQVSITGAPNSDGSMTAQSVQIRPNTPVNMVK